MIWTTFLAEPAVLWPWEPHWGDQVSLTARLLSRVDRALSAVEAREEQARSARYRLEFTAVTRTIKASTLLRQGLDRLRGERILMPLWTDGVELADPLDVGATVLQVDGDQAARAGAWWVILNEETLVFELVQVASRTSSTITLAAGTAFAWPRDTRIYPLLCCRFEQRPEATTRGPEQTLVRVAVVEDAPFALRVAPPTAADVTVGAGVPDLSDRPLLATSPDVSDPPTETSAVDVQTIQAGFGRELGRYDYANPARRMLDLQYRSLNRLGISELERFFIARRGQVEAFMVPTWRDDLQLTSDVASGAAVLDVAASAYTSADYAGRPGQPYLALIDGDGVVVPVRVDSIGLDGLTLDVVTPRAFVASTTMLSHLLLARFGQTDLEWTYQNGRVAATRLRMIEVPGEYEAEAPAATRPATLFTFTEQTPTPTVWRVTSYEEAITRGGHTWSPAVISHGDIKQSLRMDREEVSVTAADVVGGPLAKYRPFRLSGRVRLEIEQMDAADPDEPGEVLFVGEIQSVEPEGKLLQARAAAWAGVFERRFPGVDVTPQCAYAIYSPACGVDPAAWRAAGTVQAASTGQTIRVQGAPLTSSAAQRFAGGWVDVTGGTIGFARLGVLASTAWGGTYLELTVHAPLVLAGGEDVMIYPGCDGSKTSCQAFGNYAKFGGFPYVPNTNPALIAVEAKGNNGGKGK